MKKYFHIAASVCVAISFGFLFMACDPEESLEERNRERLIQSSWTVNSVVVDGVDKTSVYENLAVTFDATSFSSENGVPIWPSSGTWDFEEGDANVIVRSDGVAMRIVTLSNTELELTFDWEANTFGSGRTASVSGSHVFIFTR